MDWVEIEDFPGYSISDTGRVRNDDTDRILALQINQHGVVHVGLFRDGKQYKRGVALLVCQAFLPPPHPPTFDTPIHLDGDSTNNRLENLMWRPRWFAIKYRQQFDHKPISLSGRLQDRHTGVIYRNSWEVATTCGLLEKDVFLATVNNSYVWPTYQEFKEVR